MDIYLYKIINFCNRFLDNTSFECNLIILHLVRFSREKYGACSITHKALLSIKSSDWYLIEMLHQCTRTRVDCSSPELAIGNLRNTRVFGVASRVGPVRSTSILILSSNWCCRRYQHRTPQSSCLYFISF